MIFKKGIWNGGPQKHTTSSFIAGKLAKYMYLCVFMCVKNVTYERDHIICIEIG